MLCDWSPIEGERAGLLAVLDGHGGSDVSTLVSRLLARKLRSVLEADTNGVLAWQSNEGRCAAIKRAFLELDRHLSRKDMAYNCGSTCVVAVVWRGSESAGIKSPYRVLLANLGDSRGLIVRDADTQQAEAGSGLVAGRTEDHKPTCELEEQRIVSAGGYVSRPNYGPPRVNGDLALSRAFGDFRLKDNASLLPEQQKVSPEPDTYEFTCHIGDTIVLACDGAYDVMSNDEVAERVSAAVRDGCPKDAARAVVTSALERGSMDNVTCVAMRVVR